MKAILFLLFALAMLAGVLGLSLTASLRATEAPAASVTAIPLGYRDWRLVSVAHEAGNLNDLRAILANDVGLKAYRRGLDPFPDGTIIARVAWAYVPSPENNQAFGREQSFVAGSPSNVQFMIKDSSRYASTGGWGFAQFTGGKPPNQASAAACFSCHEPMKARDFVFTRYSP